MIRFLTKLTGLLDDGAASLFPGYFAVVMATGAASVASHLLGYEALALLLLVANALAFTALCILTIVRLLRYPRRLAADMMDHARAPGFFTLVAGTCILGSQFQILLAWHQVAFVLWLLGVGLWIFLMYTFFIVVTVRRRKPALAEGINGAWLLVAVSTQSVAILTVLLARESLPEAVLFLALCMYFIGSMLYLAIIPLIFYRLTFQQVTAESLSPPYWINMGAAAITTLAGSTLTGSGSGSELLAPFLPFLTGLTLFFWAVASWWIPLLLGLMVWRHLVRRQGLVYEPQLWSMVFPVAMYATATTRLASVLDLEFLMPVALAALWLAWLLWGLTSFGMWRYFAHRIRETWHRQAHSD